MKKFPPRVLTALVVCMLSTEVALAAGAHSGGHETSSIGAPGDAHHVDREITVTLGEMFFSPSSIDIDHGETIRFTIVNGGEFAHEFNIATMEMHLDHGAEMENMIDSGVLEVDRINHNLMTSAGMNHSDPNSVLLEPGQTGEIIWTFNGDANIELSCNIPGHRDGGMLGELHISE